MINKSNALKIISQYSLPFKVANYLVGVDKIQDYKEYENHKQNLMRLCSPNNELKKAIRCLIQRMEI